MIDLTVSSQLPRCPCSFSSKDSEFLPETPRSTARGQTGRGRSQNSEEGGDGCLLCQKVKNGSSSELCQATGENLEIYEGGLQEPSEPSSGLSFPCDANRGFLKKAWVS